MPPRSLGYHVEKTRTADLLCILAQNEQGLLPLARRYQDALLEYVESGRTARIPWQLHAGYTGTIKVQSVILTALLRRVSETCDEQARDFFSSLLDAYGEFREGRKGLGYQALGMLLKRRLPCLKEKEVYDLLPDRSSRLFRDRNVRDGDLQRVALETMASLGYRRVSERWVRATSGTEGGWFDVVCKLAPATLSDKMTLAQLEEHILVTESNLGLIHASGTELSVAGLPEWWKEHYAGLQDALRQATACKGHPHPEGLTGTQSAETSRRPDAPQEVAQDVPSSPGRPTYQMLMAREEDRTVSLSRLADLLQRDRKTVRAWLEYSKVRRRLPRSAYAVERRGFRDGRKIPLHLTLTALHESNRVG